MTTEAKSVATAKAEPKPARVRAQVVLCEPWDIGGERRERGFVLLEGSPVEGVALSAVDQAVRVGRAQVLPAP